MIIYHSHNNESVLLLTAKTRAQAALSFMPVISYCLATIEVVFFMRGFGCAFFYLENITKHKKGKKEMNVWIMNLKDNRNPPDSVKLDRKFQICKLLGILSIGWAEDTSHDNAFEKAYDGIKNMAIRDLVWTKNPMTKENYLCRITGDFEKETGALNREDIGYSIPCEFKKVDDTLLSQNGITKEQLFSRSTLQKCHDADLIKSTHALNKIF